jgi:hypothetical protein
MHICAVAGVWTSVKKFRTTQDKSGQKCHKGLNPVILKQGLCDTELVNLSTA